MDPVSNRIYCSEHPAEQVIRVCLAESCSRKPLLCILCSQQRHSGHASSSITAFVDSLAGMSYDQRLGELVKKSIEARKNCKAQLANIRGLSPELNHRVDVARKDIIGVFDNQDQQLTRQIDTHGEQLRGCIGEMTTDAFRRNQLSYDMFEQVLKRGLGIYIKHKRLVERLERAIATNLINYKEGVRLLQGTRQAVEQHINQAKRLFDGSDNQPTEDHRPAIKNAKLESNPTQNASYRLKATLFIAVLVICLVALGRSWFNQLSEIAQLREQFELCKKKASEVRPIHKDNGTLSRQDKKQPQVIQSNPFPSVVPLRWSTTLKHPDIQPQLLGRMAVRVIDTTKSPKDFFPHPVAILADQVVGGGGITSWKFRVGMVNTNGMALGMCLDQKQQIHSFIGGNWWSPLTHGMYLVRPTVNYAYGDPTVNQVTHNLKFTSLDWLSMKYDAEKGTLTVKKNGAQFFQFKKVLKSDNYRPCAYLWNVRDSVQIYPGDENE